MKGPCLISIIFLWGCGGTATEQNVDGPIASFEIEEGFSIELIASEPLISDPVDMEIDEYGRLYVVEMHGYPLDKSGSGKIKILSDTDKDGKFDKSTIFAEDLILPNSIMRWKKGVIVTDAPNVLYLEDSDGDGKAEIRDTLLTGFALSNPQHNLNSPLLGIDNWIYLAHEGAVGTETYATEFGDRGKEIFFPNHPRSPRLSTNAGGRAVRIQPDRYTLEMTSSHSQFGHTFDAWGHHLQVGNADHIFQEAIAETYLHRNSDLLISDATQNLSDHGEAAEVFPITQNPQHQLLTDVGVITSACGITAYLGGAFPSLFDHAVFVCEPVSNLIHVDLLKEKGSTFTASRLRPHQEFLASTDPKFRPVNLYTGPDGALYVIDYYRQIIEHPEWMGEEVVKSGTLYNDSDKGRIYRISSPSTPAADWIKGMSWGDTTNQELVNNLSSPNYWWRLNAQRLLIDRKSSPALIKDLLQMANISSPTGRLHALWTLEGISELNSESIIRALADPISGVRENAIKLAEAHLANDDRLVKILLDMKNDPDARVRYQLLCTLGSIDSPEAFDARQAILFHDIDDQWVQMASLTGPASRTGSMLNSILENYNPKISGYASLLRKLTAMLGVSGNSAELHALLKKAIAGGDKNNWQGPVLEGLAVGLNEREDGVSLASSDENVLIKAFFEHPDAAVRRGALHVLKSTRTKNEVFAKTAIARAASRASDSNEKEDKRCEALEFISLGDPEKHTGLLTSLVIPTQPLSIQLAALRTFSEAPDEIVSAFLLKKWKTLTPDLRDAGVKALLKNETRVAILLRAIEQGEIKTTDLNWPRKVGLMAQSNVKLRDQARALFTKNSDSTTNTAYQKALKIKGEISEGTKVYEQQCALCHQIRGEGGMKLGPDLGTIHNWSPEAIMANILAPNQSISSGYDLWAITLNNGEQLQGIIASETPGAITFHNAGNWEKTIRREDIKSLTALDISVMPTGLDKQISIQQMADLLAFLKKNK